MKLVFFDTGDYIEFEPANNPFIKKWFEFLFDKDLNMYSLGKESLNQLEPIRKQLNNCIDKANAVVEKINPSLINFFTKLEELDQNILNENHKKWALFTESNLNALYPQPDFWRDVNNHIHSLEGYYSIFFKNIASQDPLGEEYFEKIEPEYCTYQHQDLLIHYTNLGRHQHNQWLTGSNVDEETNNYKTVSLNFEYKFNLSAGSAYQRPEIHPPEYIEWCKQNNMQVLPPWIRIGTFTKIDRFEVRKIIHRNLKNNKLAGFSYD